MTIQAAASGKAKIDALLKLISSATQAAVAEYEKTGYGVPAPDALSSHPLDSVPDALALKKAIRILEGACEQLCTTLAQPMHTIINRGMPYEYSCLRVIIETSIADILLKHPDGLHIDKIAKQVNLESGKLSRIMRLLATRSCFVEVSENIFANNRLSLTLVSTNPTASMVGIITGECGRAVNNIYDCLVDPEYGPSYDSTKSPFMHYVKEEIVGGAFFDWYKLHPKRQERFGRAMIGWTGVTGALAVIKHFPWDKMPTGTTVCDVGAGVGAITIKLARAHPHLKITLQDISSLEQAKKLWMTEYPEAVEHGQVQFVPLDFFKEAPVKGQDVYYMKHIMHDWHDLEAIEILRNVRKAMLPISRLFIHEYVLQRPHAAGHGQISIVEKAPEPLLSNFGSGNIRLYNQDLTMLGVLNGKERTFDEFVVLGRNAGLQLIKVWDYAETSMLEFRLPDDCTDRDLGPSM